MRWPLVGRERELEAIGEALSRTASGVVISGAPGVGKTRLAAEAERLARARGFAVEWVRATASARTLPLGAVAPLISADDAPGEPVELLGRARRTLEARAAGRPLLLCVDDGHLLDDASAALVHQVVASGGALSAVTLRAGEAVPDALQALWKDELCALLELTELARDELAQLLERVLGAPLDGRSKNALWKLTRGNPLFLREAVRVGRADGTLAEDGGVWRWRGPLRPGMRLAELVGVRLDGLAPDERAVLELAAVAAPLQTDLLEPAEAPALERLELAGLAVRRREGRREFAELAHPLYGEAVRGQRGDGRRAALYERLAAGVERHGVRRSGDVLRLAVWRLEAGAGDATLFERAAAQALAALDPVLAERLAHAAVRAGGGFGAKLAFGRALAGAGRADEAWRVLEELFGEAPDDEGRAAVAVAAARNLFWALGRADEALAFLHAAERQTGDRAVRDDLVAHRVRLLAARGRPREALDAAAPLLGRDGADGSRLSAAIGATEALFSSGRTASAVALADRWLPVARERREALPHAEVVLLGMRGMALRLAGRLVEATEVSESAYRMHLERRSVLPSAVEAISLGLTWLARGRVQTALRLFRESAALLRDADAVGMRAVALAGIAQAAAQAGDPETARQAAEELERTPLGHQAFLAELDQARAWSAAAAGELTRARALAERAAGDARARGQDAYAVAALHALTRFGDFAAAAPALSALAENVDGSFASAAAAHATALVTADAPALEDVAERFAQDGALLLAAEAWHAAAAAHREAGRIAGARSAAAHAARLLRACEGAAPITLAGAPQAEGLTRREREIALLAASGLSSREIAGRLVVSVRTVDNHLQRVYRKLGVAGRRGLAGVFGATPE